MNAAMDSTHSDALVFFGATGDLAYKKVFPSLFAMLKRGHADLGNPVAVQADLAQFHQPFRGSYDTVRRGLRRDVPAVAYGPSLAGVLDVPLPEQHGGLAPIP